MPSISHISARSRLAVAIAVAGVVALAGCTAREPKSSYYATGPIENQLMAEIALQRGEYLVAVQQYLSLAQKTDDPDVAQRATELAYDYGFDAYALAAAERWALLRPDDADAHYYLGRLYAARNQTEQAWTSLNIALGPPEQRSDEDYLVLSQDLAERASASTGLALYQRFSTEYPDVPGITGALAGLAADAGQFDIAIAAARETVVLAPEWTGARVWLARFLLASGERSSAFEQMAFAVEMEPGLDMELEFVQLVASAGEYEDALERLARLQERFPDSADLRRARAIVLLDSGDVAAAEAEFTQLLSDAYFVDECFWYLGQIAFRQQNYQQAARYFRRVSTSAWLWPAQRSLSLSYIELDQLALALEVQQEFAAAEPKRAFATLPVQAEILIRMGRSDEALEVINRALDYKPWSAELWLYRGGLNEQRGEFADAIKAFTKAVEFAPDNATALNALGYTLTITTRRYAEAQQYISRALELEPDNAAIMDSMGWVLFKQDKVDESRVWLERALAQLPDPEIAAHLGEVLWTQGDKAAATRIWTSARELHPDNKVLNETIERFIP